MLIAAMGILFLLWYVGLPSLGLTGAREERLLSAIAQLEMKADLQRNLVIADLQDSSADLMFIAESDEIKRTLFSSSSKQSGSSTLAVASVLSAQLEKKFQILGKLRSQRFTGLMLIDLQSKTVLAATASGQQRKIPDQDLNALIAMPNFDSHILSWSNTDLPAAQSAHTLQAIVLPVRETASAPISTILVGLLDLELFVQDRLTLDASLVKRFGTTLLFDAKANLIFSFPKILSTSPLYIPNQTVMGGFEGSVSQRNAADEELIAVYRNLPLSPTQMWTMVLVTKKTDVLAYSRISISC